MIDDVKKLLDGDFGGDRILKDIYRACKNNEPISNYERKYVRDLAQRYLHHIGHKKQDTDVEESDIVPDVELPKDLNVARKQKQSTVNKKHKQPHTDDNSVRLISSTAKKTSASKGKLFAISVGAIILVLIIVAFVFVTMTTPSLIDDVSVNNLTEPFADEFNVKTDLDSYAMGDLISISGWSDAVTGSNIELIITNPTNETVWTESTVIKSDGVYSTITIAGGDSGWAQLGVFTIHANDGDGNMVMSEFTIISN